MSDTIEIVPQNLDCRKIVEELARLHPNIYYELVDPENGYKLECVRLWGIGLKMEAINLYRTKHPELLLRDAKREVEQLYANITSIKHAYRNDSNVDDALNTLQSTSITLTSIKTLDA